MGKNVVCGEAPESRTSLLRLPSRASAPLAVQNSWSWESASFAASKPASGKRLTQQSQVTHLILPMHRQQV